MKIEQLISNIDGFIAALNVEMPALADEIALNSIAMIKRRIVDERKGLPGEAYSTKPMLATKDQFVVVGAFKQSKVDVIQYLRRTKTIRIASQSGRSFTTKKISERVESKSGRSFKTRTVKKPLWIKFPGAAKAVPVMLLENGYRQFREIQGRPGDHVNLSLTGKMWQGTTITARHHQGYTWITIIGGGNEEAQNKLKWMTKKYGPFLTLTVEEQASNKRIFDARLQSIYNRFFQ